MKKDVEWFCYLGVDHGVFAKESIVALMEISDPNTEIMVFAQAVLDNRFTEDVAAIQELLEQANYAAHEHGNCPESLIGTPSAGDIPAPTPAATEAAAAPKAPPTEGYPFSLDGFPDLSEAETADDERCKELVVQFLRAARANGSSDVHISSNAYPFVRHYGNNYLISNQPILSKETARKLNVSLLSEVERQEFEEKSDLDYCCSLTQTERYRTNVMIHNDGVEGSYRIVSDSIKTLAELGFSDPAILEKLTTYHQGLILITGPASAGKTTTLASMVQLINNSRKDHIITVEDPVEILIPSKGCNVTQRELHSSTKSFPNALKAALREDPDIIILGEMRDLETIEMGISAAETGHLVIGTLHTTSASATLDRILDVFPPEQQPQIRAMVAESLRGIICQFLVPSKDNSRLYMAPEILIGNVAVANLIKDDKTAQLNSVIETGSKKGMVLKEDSFLRLYLEGKISAESALPMMVSDAKRQQIQAAEGMV